MKIKEIIRRFCNKKESVPVIIIKKSKNNSEIKEYNTLDEAVAELEKDPNVPADKIEKIKSSLLNMQNKNTIRIRNGEIID